MVTRLLLMVFALGPMLVLNLGRASETQQTDDPSAARLAEKLVAALSSPSRRERAEAEESLLTLLREGRLSAVPVPSESHPALDLALSRIRRQSEMDAAKIAFSAFPVDKADRSSRSALSPKSVNADASKLSEAVVQCCRLTAVGTRVQNDQNTVPNLIHVRVRCEVSPNVRPLTLTLRDADFSLSIDGIACPPFSPDGMRELTCESQTLEFTISFQAPATIKLDRVRLRGQLQLRAAAGENVIAFPLGKNNLLPRQVGASEARLLSVDATPFGLETRLVVALPTGTKWESYLVEGLYRNISLVTENGTLVPANEVFVSENIDGTHTIVCRFPDVREFHSNDRLQLPLYALISNLELPFELKTIPIHPVQAEVKK